MALVYARIEKAIVRVRAPLGSFDTGFQMSMLRKFC
jgi:hypothetical protein